MTAGGWHFEVDIARKDDPSEKRGIVLRHCDGNHVAQEIWILSKEEATTLALRILDKVKEAGVIERTDSGPA